MKTTSTNTIGTLYVVATPIGNLGDITYRAIEILRMVDIILCEDTRTTKKLLDAYTITTKTTSYHAHSSSAKHDAIIEMLSLGKNIALVSDAGTPAISDPGAMIVRDVYDAFGNDAQVVSIPGPSAVTAALSISGLFGNEYTFVGFVPHKKGRETLFKEIAERDGISVAYESTHRMEKLLESLERFCGEKRTIVVAKELTKMYEQVVRGTAMEVRDYFAKNKDRIRGEFVVVIGPK